MRFEGAVINGLTDPDKREIVIGISDEDVMTQTFLHELNHAILSELGLHLTTLEENLEELIVDNIAKTYMKLFDIEIKKKG